MTLRRSLTLFILGVLVLTSSAGALAAGGGPGGGLTDPGTISAPDGSGELTFGFTYQGELQTGSSLVNATCNFQFSLFDNMTDGTQLGPTLSGGLPVVAGRFTAYLNFGANHYDGNVRWLAVAVQCPPDAGFTPLLPRQPLSATPLALSLPGLRTEPYVVSANVIGGYSGNSVTAGNVGATIGGGGNAGAPNHVIWDYGTVGGGKGNSAASVATVAGGNFNTATTTGATVGGGQLNTAGADATVGGGDRNTANGVGAFIGGGGDDGTIRAGNLASGAASVVGGGISNNASAVYAVVGGGITNTASSVNATVAGGYLNTASGAGAAIGGGFDNTVGGVNSVVAGGQGNTASGNYAAVIGGFANSASGTGAVIGGGGYNGSLFLGNLAGGTASTIGGGINNSASGGEAVIGGGEANQVTGGANHGTVSGGISNTVSAISAVVAGGHQNTASGANATVAGGGFNMASGAYTFAAGRGANAVFDGDFVWADDAGVSITAAVSDEFLVRSTGGIQMTTNAGGTTGCGIAAGGGSWLCTSDRNLKANFASVDDLQVLNALAGIPIETWNFKTQDAAIRHMGPMAQDFHSAFGVGENDTTIGTVDAQGVALAGIQGLYQLDQQKDAQIAALQAHDAQTDARLAALEAKAAPAGQPAQLPVALPWLLLGGLVLLNVGGAAGYLLARQRARA